MAFTHLAGGIPIVSGQVITNQQFTGIFRDLERAYDSVGGSAGVVSAPSTAILIGGSGLTVSGQFTASGATATLSATATAISGALTCSSTVALNGATTVAGAMTVNATGTLTTNAASTSTFAGPISSSGANAWSGTQTFTDDIIQSGDDARHIIRYGILDETDAAITFTATKDVWIVNAPTNAATVYTVDTPVGAGALRMSIRVYGLAAGRTVVIERGGGEDIVTLAPVGASKFFGVDLEWSGSRWRLGMICGDEAFTYDNPA